MPSLGIAPHPGGCISHLVMLTQVVAPVSGVFPAGVFLHLLEIEIQAVKL
jgi:hypothetical protein